MLDAPKKIVSRLKNYGIDTIEKLLQFNSIELYSMNILVKKLVIILEESLAKLGLSLGGNVSLEKINESCKVFDRQQEVAEKKLDDDILIEENETLDLSAKSKKSKMADEMPSWKKKYKIIEQFYNENGHILFKKGFYYNGLHCHVWLSTQINNRNKGRLSDSGIEALDKLGMIWDIKSLEGKKRYKEILNSLGIKEIQVVDGQQIYVMFNGKKQQELEKNTESLTEKTITFNDEIILINNETISNLSETVQNVLRLRYGLDDGIQMSFEEVGARLNIDKNVVYQMEFGATVALANQQKLGDCVEKEKIEEELETESMKQLSAEFEEKQVIEVKTQEKDLTEEVEEPVIEMQEQDLPVLETIEFEEEPVIEVLNCEDIKENQQEEIIENKTVNEEKEEVLSGGYKELSIDSLHQLRETLKRQILETEKINKEKNELISEIMSLKEQQARLLEESKQLDEKIQGLMNSQVTLGECVK